MKLSDIAKQLGYKTSDLLKLARNKGIEIKSIRSVIDEKTALSIRSFCGKSNTQTTQESPPSKLTCPHKSSIAPATHRENSLKTFSQPLPRGPKIKSEKQTRSISSPLIDVDKIIGREEEIRSFKPSELQEAEKTGLPPKEKRFPRQPIKKARDFLWKYPRRKLQFTGAPHTALPQKPHIKKRLEVVVPCSLREFSSLTSIKPNLIIKKLLEQNIFLTINAILDEDQVTLIAVAFDLDIEIKKEKTQEEKLLSHLEPDNPEDQVPRAPVVTFMGHVDHGKTTLLDKIRKTNVAATEAGQITQHIGASKIKTKEGKFIVLLDTPGHKAFTAMRARGANVTDIVVLVVAADDGVMPQTEEAIAHAKEANVPIIVAINKIDKNGANPSRVKHQLSQLGLIPEEWSGNVPFVEVSAISGKNVDSLVELLSIQADLLELKANPKKRGSGTVLEVKKNPNRGIVATVLVQNGILKKGDPFVCGSQYGRVKTLEDESGKQYQEVYPSTPVEVTGFSGLPEAGDKIIVVPDIKTATSIALERRTMANQLSLSKKTHLSLENLYTNLESAKTKEIRVIIKGDVKGSVEVLREQIKNISVPNLTEVKVKIIHSGVGDINESDVILADASDAIIIGFNVRIENSASNLAAEKHIDIKIYDVIYKIIEEMKLALEGLLRPEEKEVVIGRLTVRKVFKTSKFGNCAGCIVVKGKVDRTASCRLIRNGKVLLQGAISSLKRFKEDVHEVQEGFECGLKIENFDDIEVGDTIEVFSIEKIMRKPLTGTSNHLRLPNKRQ